MESSMDEDSFDSNATLCGSSLSHHQSASKDANKKKCISVVNKIINRQLYGRFTKNPRSSTEKIYTKIPERCNMLLSDVLPILKTESSLHHIYMGFTLCGRYMLSYTWTAEEDLQSIHLFYIIYYLYVWRYTPGQRLTMVSKQKIFRHCRTQEQFLDVNFSQWPTDSSKVVAYGVNVTYPAESYITIVFLPTLKKCLDCRNGEDSETELSSEQMPCLRHCVTVDFMMNITTPFPAYDPVMHLAYPDHIVMNTGHYLHIINVLHVVPQPSSGHLANLLDKIDEPKAGAHHCFSDTLSDFSDVPSELDGAAKSNVVDAIIQDFSEYDFDSNDCSKPFHELNISCEPLNVTGKSYHMMNHFKILQSKETFLGLNGAQCSTQKYYTNPNTSTQKFSSYSSIQKSEKIKIAEKAYEFTEDNEKCEKLSSFRKKRLADKKYEFSEDNSENIIPFNLLRQERRYLYRAHSSRLRSPDIGSSYFVSPRQGIRSPRSPMLSPNARQGQFSPSSPRNIYCPSLRVSPGNCRSPISPRDQMRRFNVYSPSHFDSDCSDNDSKLVLRSISNVQSKTVDLAEPRAACNAGLLIVDGKKAEERPRWIRKVVKKFCSLDFESASLVSDVQSRDEYLCIELPVLVYTANNTQIDAAPSRLNDELIGSHLKVTQKTFDFDQFCQRRAEKLCAENRLKFTHCEDYDIKIQQICPLSGDIVCTAEIKIGAVKDQTSNNEMSQTYITGCMFVWNLATDSYKVMEYSGEPKLVNAKMWNENAQSAALDNVPEINCKKVRTMAHKIGKSLSYLRDSDNLIQISLDRRKIEGLIDLSDLDYDSEYSDTRFSETDSVSDIF